MSPGKPTERREERILGLSEYFTDPRNSGLKRKEIFRKFMSEKNPGVSEETLKKDMWTAVTFRSFFDLPMVPFNRLTEYQKKGSAPLIERYRNEEQDSLFRGQEDLLKKGVEAFLSHEPIKEEFMERMEIALNELPEGREKKLLKEALSYKVLNNFQNKLGGIGVLMDEIGEKSRKQGYWIFHPRVTEAHKWMLAGHFIHSLPRIIEILKSEKLEPKEKENFVKETVPLLLKEHLRRSDAHRQYLEAEASWVRALEEKIKGTKPPDEEEIGRTVEEIKSQFIPPELETFVPQNKQEADTERERIDKVIELMETLFSKFREGKTPEEILPMINQKRKEIYGQVLPAGSKIPKLLEEIHSETTRSPDTYRQYLTEVLNALERKRVNMLPLYREIKKNKDILELPGDILLAKLKTAIEQAAAGGTPRISIPPLIEKLFKEFAPLAAKNISLANEAWAKVKETEKEKERLLRKYEEKTTRPAGA